MGLLDKTNDLLAHHCEHLDLLARQQAALVEFAKLQHAELQVIHRRMDDLDGFLERLRSASPGADGALARSGEE